MSHIPLHHLEHTYYLFHCKLTISGYFLNRFIIFPHNKHKIFCFLLIPLFNTLCMTIRISFIKSNILMFHNSLHVSHISSLLSSIVPNLINFPIQLMGILIGYFSTGNIIYQTSQSPTTKIIIPCTYVLYHKPPFASMNVLQGVFFCYNVDIKTQGT